MEKKQRPVHSIRYGRTQAAIWKNKSEKGTFYNVTFSRSYISNGESRNTDSFGLEDLLAVSKLADQAHSWIVELRESKVEVPRTAPPEEQSAAVQ